MKTLVLAGVIWSTAAFAWADCPVTHPALTKTDHDSMAAAYAASFRGAFHREPTWQRGAGVDDGEFWIAASDHYGAYSDGICRAGWNRYRELQLACNGCPVDPRRGDEPAQFQPETTPPVVVPPPAPAPIPGTTLPNLGMCDLSDVTARLARVEAGVLAIGVDLKEHRAAEQSAWASVRHYVALYGKYIGPAVAGVLAGMQAK